MRIELVTPDMTRPVRKRFLMQHRTLDDLARSDGDYPQAGYFVARTPNAGVLGTASIRPERPPWAPNARDAWRIRGMVTVPQVRSQGIGLRLLEVVIAHASAHGARFLWCNVRSRAIPFYERAGLQPTGDPWQDPDTGPHIAMYRLLDPS
jgi:GNAT superfamily N-acetyltransferase